MTAGRPIRRTTPSGYEIPLEPFSATFTEIEVGSDVRPTLPNGRTGITDRQAVAAATASGMGEPGPQVDVAARYGIYSSDFPAKGLPSGDREPFHQNRPVWLVTFFGPGYKRPIHRPDPAGNVVFKHQFNVVVDASTEIVLEAFG